MKKDYLKNEDGTTEALLAKVLGIKLSELRETEWRFDNNYNADGFESNLLVIFDESSPKKILKAIKGLDDNYMVWLEPHSLENAAHDYKRFAHQLGITFEELLYANTVLQQNDDES